MYDERMGSGKTALIVHGGALKSAYAGGFISKLGTLGIRAFDYVVGTSASVGNVAYYATGQYEDIRNVWIETIGGNLDFVSVRRWLAGRPPFDVPYLLEVIRRKTPLDVGRMSESASTVLLPMYNYKKKRHEYFSNRDRDARERIWDALTVGMTVHGEHIVCKGEDCYVDTEIEPYAIYHDPPFRDAQHVLIVTNHVVLDFDVQKKLGNWLFRTIQNGHFPLEVIELLKRRSAITRRNLVLLGDFCKERDVLIHSPSQSVGIRPWTLVDGGKENIRHLFHEGERAAERVVRGSESRELMGTLISRSKVLEARKYVTRIDALVS